MKIKRPDIGHVLMISNMRDEGPYILEWLAWHRSLGFDNILVVTNDCSDGSDDLLDHLAERKLLHHATHSPPDGTFALRSAFRTSRRHAIYSEADWVFVADADEFLVVHCGDRTIHDLIGKHNDALGIGINWRCFGDGGVSTWSDGFVREVFTKAAPGPDQINTRIKSVFREPGKFKRLLSHAPMNYQGDWESSGGWVNAAGAALDQVRLLDNNRVQRIEPHQISHRDAQINHYVIKSQENMIERRQKWQSSGLTKRYSDDFVQEHNINAEEDLSALQSTDRFQEEYARIATPEALGLHHRCCALYASKLARLQGLDPEDDPRVRHHQSLAG